MMIVLMMMMMMTITADDDDDDSYYQEDDAQGQYWAGRTLSPNSLPSNMAANDLRCSEMPVV